MATTIPELVETSDPPLSTDSDAQFDAKAFPWAASLNPFGQSVSEIAIAARENAEDALAAALGGDLPPLTGKAGEFLRVKADESGAEFAEVPEPVTQPTADWEAGTSTIEGIVSPAKVKAAVDANGLGSEIPTDLSGSRLFETSFQNTTGKPILVGVSNISNNESNTSVFEGQISDDNSTWIKLTVGVTNGGSNDFLLVMVVPDNYYYRATKVSGPNTDYTVSAWFEA